LIKRTKKERVYHRVGLEKVFGEGVSTKRWAPKRKLKTDASSRPHKEKRPIVKKYGGLKKEIREANGVREIMTRGNATYPHFILTIAHAKFPSL